jgi:hypothetical protein
MSFYEDFRAFVSYLDKQLKTREIGPRLSGRNRTKVGDLTRRVVELGIRFERKLDDAEDSQTLPAIRDVLMRLSEALLEAGAAADANTALFELWNRGWVDRSDDLQQLIRRTSTDLVKERIPLLNEAVRTGTGSRAALVNVLEVPGVSMIA